VKAEAPGTPTAGQVSNYLHNASIGDQVLLAPPSGDFVVANPDADIALVGGICRSWQIGSSNKVTPSTNLARSASPWKNAFYKSLVISLKNNEVNKLSSFQVFKIT
jgi:Na+-transporting NADH:ubiquinone oxidoreductase subunit NqrF